MNTCRRHKSTFSARLGIAVAVLLVLAPAGYAELERSLRFIPDKVDFGRIPEEGGKVSQEVKAVNISPDSTFIISARTGCGCSVAEYTDDVLAPGDTATVTLTYDPLGRPGRFLKTAKFFTGEERVGNSIKLTGTVIPSQTSLDRSYPDQAGPLRLSSRILSAGQISREEARPLFVGIYNDSQRTLAIMADTDSDPLEAAVMPDTIEPNGVATLSLMLKGRLIPAKDTEFVYRTFLIDRESGDTIATIPVGGAIKQ